MDEDILEIMQVTTKERFYWQREATRLWDCYWPSATITTSWQDHPLLTDPAKVPIEIDPAFPVVGQAGTPIVQQVGQRAFVELPTTTHFRLIDQNLLVELTSARRFLYRVTKRDGEWRISDVTVIHESDELLPVVPGLPYYVDSAVLGRFRESYQFLSYIREQGGEEISHQLFGTDRPYELADYYQRELKWLNSQGEFDLTKPITEGQARHVAG